MSQGTEHKRVYAITPGNHFSLSFQMLEVVISSWRVVLASRKGDYSLYPVGLTLSCSPRSVSRCSLSENFAWIKTC